MKQHYLGAPILIVMFCAFGYSQHTHQGTQPKEKEKEKMNQMQDMKQMEHTMNPASDFLMSEGAGTGVNPGSVAMSMPMRKILFFGPD